MCVRCQPDHAAGIGDAGAHTEVAHDTCPTKPDARHRSATHTRDVPSRHHSRPAHNADRLIPVRRAALHTAHPDT